MDHLPVCPLATVRLQQAPSGADARRMFVITRRPGETILIGGIEVTVLSGPNASGEVSIGVDAPRSMAVVRVDGVVQLTAEDRDTPPSLRTAP